MRGSSAAVSTGVAIADDVKVEAKGIDRRRQCWRQAAPRARRTRTTAARPRSSRRVRRPSFVNARTNSSLTEPTPQTEVAGANQTSQNQTTNPGGQNNANANQAGTQTSGGVLRIAASIGGTVIVSDVTAEIADGVTIDSSGDLSVKAISDADAQAEAVSIAFTQSSSESDNVSAAVAFNVALMDTTALLGDGTTDGGFGDGRGRHHLGRDERLQGPGPLGGRLEAEQHAAAARQGGIGGGQGTGRRQFESRHCRRGRLQRDRLARDRRPEHRERQHRGRRDRHRPDGRRRGHRAPGHRHAEHRRRRRADDHLQGGGGGGGGGGSPTPRSVQRSASALLDFETLARIGSDATVDGDAGDVNVSAATTFNPLEIVSPFVKAVETGLDVTTLVIGAAIGSGGDAGAGSAAINVFSFDEPGEHRLGRGRRRPRRATSR